MTVSVVGEGRARIEEFVDVVVVYAAVKLVGARLHSEVKKPATRLPELRGVIAGLDGDLLNRLDAGLVCGSCGHARARWAGRASSRCVLAFHSHRRGVAGQAVYTEAVVGQPGVPRQHGRHRVNTSDTGGTHEGVPDSEDRQIIERFGRNV